MLLLGLQLYYIGKSTITAGICRVDFAAIMSYFNSDISLMKRWSPASIDRVLVKGMATELEALAKELHPPEALPKPGRRCYESPSGAVAIVPLIHVPG